jgi:hypothetical protein
MLHGEHACPLPPPGIQVFIHPDPNLTPKLLAHTITRKSNSLVITQVCNFVSNIMQSYIH